MKLERVIHPDKVREGINALVHELLSSLGRVPTDGVKVTIETSPATALDEITRPTVTMDFAQREATGKFTYTCCCGWETQDAVSLVQHLERHGARRLAVVPENWVPK